MASLKGTVGFTRKLGEQADLGAELLKEVEPQLVAGDFTENVIRIPRKRSRVSGPAFGHIYLRGHIHLRSELG